MYGVRGLIWCGCGSISSVGHFVLCAGEDELVAKNSSYQQWHQTRLTRRQQGIVQPVRACMACRACVACVSVCVRAWHVCLCACVRVGDA